MDFKTLYFADTDIPEMFEFLDKHWERVLNVIYVPEAMHPGGYPYYQVNLVRKNN